MLDAQGNYTVNLPDEALGNGTNGGSTGVASPQVYTGSWDDPNGHVTPDDPDSAATYYKDGTNPVWKWAWSIENQNWFETQGA
jgi:hypothetical protein